ncbi:hypothetical protein EGW08_010040, partial [Elysia chlorotica]
DLDDLLRVPHGVLVLAVVALLALLAVQLKHHIARVGGRVQVEPEDHATLHGRPAHVTDLAGEPDLGTVLEDAPSLAGWHEGREQVPRVVGVLGEQAVKLPVPYQFHS